MGCDGGTVPKRKEIVRNKERQPKRQRVDKAAAEKWKDCTICDWVLKKPIVAGHYGHIFCKECVLQFLYDHKVEKTLPSYDLLVEKSPALDTIHSRKDFKELKLKENPDIDNSQASSSEDDTIKADYVCPITGLETNGKHKFVFSWKCGCVVSERAIKEVPNDNKCLVCQKPYQETDIVTLLTANEKEFEVNQAKFMVRGLRKILPAEMLTGGKSNSSQESSKSSQNSSRPGQEASTSGHRASTSNYRASTSSHRASTSNHRASASGPSASASRQEPSTSGQGSKGA